MKLFKTLSIIVENFTDTVVARNGSTIMELAEDLTIDTSRILATVGDLYNE